MLALALALALATVLLGSLVLGVLPRLRTFRTSVDARGERRAAAALRVAVLGRMSPDHCDELDALEGLAAGIRRRFGGGVGMARGTSDPSVERWLGLDRLLALYAELAVTHQGNVTTFCARDRIALDCEGEQLRELSMGRSGPSDVWLQRRRTIHQRRQEVWQRAVEERDLLVQGMAAIGGVLRWMHELCTVVMGDSVRSEVDDVLASWESNGATLRELSGLRSHADVPAVDPRALALGREVAAQAAAGRVHSRERTPGWSVTVSQPPGALSYVHGMPMQACQPMPLSAAAGPPGGAHVEPLPRIGFVLRPPDPETPPRLA
jgi:hypothetical protein